MKKNRQLKRVLATLAALLLLMPMTAGAETINTVTSSEDLTKTSTVYVGEVVVDGVTQIKYLYSGNMSINSIVLDGLYGCLSGMVDGDYAALLDATRVFNSIYITTNTLALCNNPELIDAMDENWSSAQYVGTLYFPRIGRRVSTILSMWKKVLCPISVQVPLKTYTILSKTAMLSSTSILLLRMIVKRPR